MSWLVGMSRKSDGLLTVSPTQGKRVNADQSPANHSTLFCSRRHSTQSRAPALSPVR